ncbi:MAG: phosphate/phosphite/phosphonate ABC transporter substrate-binding protein [Candidatus Rokuibacteriota bacterium]
MKVLAAVAIVAALVGVGSGFAIWGGDSGASDHTITLAILPTATAGEIAPRAAELEHFLEDQTGYNVDILIPTTYSAVVEAIRFRHADAAFMSAWPMHLAAKHAEAQVALAEVRSVTINGSTTDESFYFSHYIVLEGRSYRTLEDVRGLRVAYTSALSTSGYLFPVDRLIELGKIPAPAAGQAADPGAFFGEVVFAGGYSQAWAALQAGAVDVAVIAGDVPSSLYNEVMNGTRVIETQGPVPSHGVVYSKDMSLQKASKLTAALMRLGDPQYRDLMRKLVSGIFVSFEQTTTEAHLGALQPALERTGFQWVDRIG